LPLRQTRNAAALQLGGNILGRREHLYRDLEVKYRAFARLAGHADVPAHEFDVLLADGQPQAGSDFRKRRVNLSARRGRR